MAIFKPMMANRSILNNQPTQDGYVWFCPDDGSFHIDYLDDSGIVKRKQITAKSAEELLGYSITNTIENVTTTIPTSSAVVEILQDYAKLDEIDLTLDVATTTELGGIKSQALTVENGEKLPVIVEEDGTANVHVELYDGTTDASGQTGVILKSSTEGSSKYFLITVDDTGTISAVEITQ